MNNDSQKTSLCQLATPKSGNAKKGENTEQVWMPLLAIKFHTVLDLYPYVFLQPRIDIPSSPSLTGFRYLFREFLAIFLRKNRFLHLKCGGI